MKMKKPIFHCFCLLIILLDKLVVTQSTTIPVNVGVVLDFESLVGKIGWSCINMALSDFYATHGRHYKTRLVLNARDSHQDVVAAAAAGSFSPPSTDDTFSSCIP
ncbi:glutamate receptor 2.8-like protein [Corchorus capsularis]|uniref:Glutamate receptor 2.8-like protein n=1 Tax=Corchorus capsularis TaxID=210143 RepID=A0A1R3H4T7_COCAP|nr:glutamate receptor 2.8-like protein [Corchorus capsularis]